MAMMTRPASVLLLLVGVAAGAGCGYSLAGRGSFLPSNIRTVAIPTFVNRTPFTNAEELITQKVREEFIGRGRFAFEEDPAVADAVLAGELVALSITTAATNSQQLASRNLITTVVKITFTDGRTKEVLWSDDALTFRDTYDLGAAGQIEGATFFDQQRSSVDRLATDVARKVVTAIVEAF
jgi:hypothetical protein